jgi:hypothetical protein
MPTSEVQIWRTSIEISDDDSATDFETDEIELAATAISKKLAT